MIKLPEKKYEPKHNDELKNYARGWNSTIENTEILCSIVGENRVKEDLLEAKEYIFRKIDKKPCFNGMFDCIVEIERLNEEPEYRLDNFFQDSLEALDKLKVERKQ